MKEKCYWIISIIIGLIIFFFNQFLAGAFLIIIGFIMLIKTEKSRAKKIISVIVYLIIMIILFYLFLFEASFGGGGPKGVFTVLSSKDFACKELIKSKCEISTYQILLNKCPDEICFDANRDGKVDENDTFQALCESFFDVERGNQTACRRICDCS